MFMSNSSFINQNTITVNLLDEAKKTGVKYCLNWGFAPETNKLRIEKGKSEPSRTGNESYLQLPKDVYETDFFPETGNFVIIDDNGYDFTFSRSQAKEKDGKPQALSTSESNRIFGLYLRHRLGLKSGQLITKNDLLNYGRTEITFKKEHGSYYMDFSSNQKSNAKNKNSSEIPYPHNRIIFGAPGTGKSFQLKKESTENSFFSEITRVTFHPDYSYSQFVGTYKPTMIKAVNKQEDGNTRQIIQVLQDKTSSSQEKYDILYDKFKDNNLTLLPFLLGLYTDDAFSTRKKDGSPTADDNNAERNHGKAIRSYVNLKSKNDGEEISYKYVPGPFLRTLVNALKSSKAKETKNYLLIIEEINRARVSAVFGDMFQLLDRNEYGESEYEIQTSEDMRNFLTEQLGGNKDDYQIIRLPDNFYIWATMNSADQGVFPMDTAFKRRWNFEYIGIDDNQDDVSASEIPINKNKKVNWNKLRQAINKKLISLNVNEDKLLGPYFIGKKDLENAMQKQEDFIKLFKSKVLMYLFDDAAKMKKGFFKLTGSRKYIYSDICKELDEKGIEVFNFSDEEKGDLKELDISPKPKNPEPASE